MRRWTKILFSKTSEYAILTFKINDILAPYMGKCRSVKKRNGDVHGTVG
ncbi:hypothetical protein CLOLEP_01617 [[Clostridium] leptum DSM 753]|uniref:Uncharacterized protein n=1 Tax=[Clostridium] leptum DSM 753 TaxID=428125 RepID=A7VSS6_9FIRM|nr:hypothetical protein CLOLEP_01617 [[Clostridium] leptum DSM 753]